MPRFLEIRLTDGRVARIDVPENYSLHDAAHAFMNREGPFAGDWVKISTGARQSHVRYDTIVEIEQSQASSFGNS
jgi:hypothetical protein